ncbi:C-terminal binding protein [Pseudomonas sp. R4-83]|uniref:C-terminal binding protein n=1 Tax=unclassified Pseudomonas TaxID=196821 RepID=UPI003DA7DEC5
MNILMIDSQRVNYVDSGEYVSGARQQLFKLEVTSKPTNEQLARADGIIAFHSVVVDEALIARMERCRALVKATIGLDDVDVDALSSKGILCSNIGSVGAQEVAEHAMALILLAQRKLLEYAAHTRHGGWNWRSHTGEVNACSDTVLGLIGYGATGRELAQRAAVMGYRICFYDPWIKQCAGDVGQCSTLESLLEVADVISLHLPLTPETRNLLSDAQFSLMKSGATIVNTARGGIVDTQALLRALESGQVSMALLDVVQEEPLVPQALLEHERVFLTPHAAFYSARSLARLKADALDTLIRLLNGEKVKTLINPECLPEKVEQHA